MTGNESLWDCALRLYSVPGIADACLTLQDESHVDVPILLFSAWLAGNKVALEAEEVGRVDNLVRQWRNEVIEPLRSVRRRLKSGPLSTFPEEGEGFRNRVKEVELGAEKIELAVLETEGRKLLLKAQPYREGSENLRIAVLYFRSRPLDDNAEDALSKIELAALGISDKQQK